MIKVENLCKKFSNKIVLNNISFELEKGEILSILGKNGAGKSTLLNCILKLLPYEEGKIFFDGEEIKNIKNKKYYSKVNAILESSENIYSYLTGYQNIVYFGRLYKLDKKEIFERADYWIDLFNMREHLHKRVSNYSRGMFQKLSIIISLLSSPELLLLDEPALGLDVISKNDMIRTLKKIVEEQKLTIILTTHQMEVIENINSKLLFLKNSEISYFGDLQDFRKLNEQNNFVMRYRKNDKIEEIFFENSSFEKIYTYAKENKIENIIEIKKEEFNLEKIILTNVKAGDENEIIY